MSDDITQLPGRIARLFTMPNPDGCHALVRVLGYYAEPSVLTEYPDGRHGAWAGSLTVLATPEEEAEFWRRRALWLEEQLKAKQPAAPSTAP